MLVGVPPVVTIFVTGAVQLSAQVTFHSGAVGICEQNVVFTARLIGPVGQPVATGAVTSFTTTWKLHTSTLLPASRSVYTTFVTPLLKTTADKLLFTPVAGLAAGKAPLSAVHLMRFTVQLSSYSPGISTAFPLSTKLPKVPIVAVQLVGSVLTVTSFGQLTAGAVLSVIVTEQEVVLRLPAASSTSKLKVFTPIFAQVYTISSPVAVPVAGIPVGTKLKVISPQLSVEPLLASTANTVTWPFDSILRVRFWQIAVGATFSSTKKLYVWQTVLLRLSTQQYSISVKPVGN